MSYRGLLGQSAIEYLMTYGWMLLIVAVAGGALFSIVGTQSIDSVSGFTGSDLNVDNFGLTDSGSIDMDVRNTAAEPIEIKQVNLSQNGEEFVTTIDEEIEVGGSSVINAVGAVESSESNVVSTEIKYDVGGLSNLTLTGTISGDLEVLGDQAEGGKLGHVKVNGEFNRVHKFEDQGIEAFEVPENIEVDVLAVGGGGGGAGATSSDGGTGGGSGRVIQFSTTVSEQAYDIVVGAGGQGGSIGENGEAGGNTEVFGQILPGGGFGVIEQRDGGEGGSGGGGAGLRSTNTDYDGGDDVVGSPEPGLGNEGGDGDNRGRGGAGGGGAGGVGSDGGAGNSGQPGGQGIQSEITGNDRWYGAGGSGGGTSSGAESVNEIGGSGGGPGERGGDALDGTGSGGGGGGEDAEGGYGGSGIVIIRYPLIGLNEE